MIQPTTSQASLWQSSRFRVIALSFVLGTILMGVKFAAYLFTGSAGILSDALESVINVAASGFALYSIYLSTQPPDSNHPYGHGKIEYFSAGFEGALIVLAAVAIGIQAVPRFFDPRPLSSLGQGMVLLVLAAGINLALAWILIRTGRRSHSLTLVADGKHLLTDVFTSLGVLVGLGLVHLTGALWLDPLIACLVAVNILVTGYTLLRESTGRLMDEADPQLLEHIVSVLNAHRGQDWIYLHQLRARRYGSTVHVDLHMILPRYYNLTQTHQTIEAIEQALSQSLGPEAEIIVHADPCTDPWCAVCALEPCEHRAEGKSERAGQPFSVQEAKAVQGHHLHRHPQPAPQNVHY